MEEYLDNDIALAKKCLTESQNEAEIQKSVDDQGNNLLEGHEDTPQDAEDLDNHKMTDSENTDNFYDAEEMPATQENAGNEETSTDEEECCYSDIEPVDVAKFEDGHGEDSSIDLVEKPENWDAGDVQAMEVCEAVNSIYGRADYICVSDDLVDGCAVATLCQIQGLRDAVVCSSLSEDLTEHDNSDEEDEEYEGNFREDSVTDIRTVVLDDESCEESDGRCLQSPTLREISEEEDNSCVAMDGLMENESLVLSRNVCMTHADSETVGGHPDVDEAAAADEDIEPNDVHADGAMIDMHNDIETINDQANVDATNSHRNADVIDRSSDSKVETVDDHHFASSSDPHFDPAREIASSYDSDIAIALEVASPKGPCPETSAVELRRSRDSNQTPGRLAVDSLQDLPPPRHVSEHTAAKPPAAIKDVPRTDSFKEPKEPVVLRSKKSKRVDSIRKSFIKLGSFGHSNGNGKTKSKKEKEKAKHEVHEAHSKSSTLEHEAAALHGQPSGQATGQGAGCGPPHCDQVQKQSSLEGHQPQSPAVTSPTGPQKRISNPLAVDAEKLQEFSTQKQNTIQVMYQQAIHEYEKRKCEYTKSPTEFNRTQMESQAKVVNRLVGQIKSKSSACQPMSSEFEAEKLRDYSTAEQREMYKHAVREYEKRKREYAKSPNEFNRAQLEVQAKAVHCLAVQIGSSPVGRPTGSLSSESDISSQPSSCDSRTSGLDTSLDSACFMEEKRDSLAGLPTSAHASATSFNPRHKKTDSLGGTSRLEATKKESSILRSHSDSFKRSRNETQDNLRQGNSSDDLSNYKMLAARQTIRKRAADDSGKSQGEHSENSSDSAIDQISPTSERPCLTRGSSSNSSLHKNREIIAIDDQEFTSDEENFDTKGGPFSDFTQLIVRPAHLAVFLHYLISNSDPSPLLFYMITETYPQGSGKELRKWAYEIFSTFLVDKAPLKINIEDAQVENINYILVNRHDKEDLMKNLFQQTRQTTPNMIAYLMADFRSKQALGLGSIYGDHELKDTLDHVEECKVIERALWSHFERFVQDEDNERNAALAAALAYFFKQHGYTNVKNSMLLERCATFNVKDKTKFPMFSKPSRKGIFQKGHHLLPQQYFAMTFCQQCQNLLCGVGNQGYQCQKCELNFHKLCSNNLKDLCCGKKTRPLVATDKPKPPSSNVFDKIKGSREIKRKPSSAASAMAAITAKETQRIPEDSTLASNPFIRMDAHEKVRNRVNTNEPGMVKTLSLPSSVKDPKLSPTTKTFSSLIFGEKDREHVKDLPPSVGQSNKSDKSEQPKSADDTKSSPTHSRSRSPENGIPGDDQSGVFDYSLPVVAENSSKPSSVRGENGFVSNDATISASNVCDSDFETEADLPSLDSVIPKEHLKKMKPKEKKRQEVINELFYTERAHVRNLKVMQRLFCQPMRNEQPVEFVNLLFPNIDEMVEVHGGLNKDFLQKRKDSENSIVGDLASILVKHFSGEMGDRFKQVCARFCEKQSQALEVLKTRQRKDPKLASLLLDTASNALCRRLELKDFLPTAMQRLTKYPLLIENLLKYTQPDSEEHSLLQLAYSSSKEILNSVNKAVRDYENRLKLSEMQKKLDKRPLENSQLNVVDYKNLDLTQHTLVYDGLLTWRFSRDRLINVHVVLLSDILLLLQKQDEKLVLRCQSSLIVAGKTDTRTTHSPIIKLNNLLVKPVATDKCAFFLVNISEQGPQIYDLVAGSKDEKNRWYKQIGDAVETYKATNPTKATISVTKSVPIIPMHSIKVAVVSNEVVTQVHEDQFASISEVAAADEEETVVGSQEDVGQEMIEQNEHTYNEPDDIRIRSTSFSDSLDALRQTDDSISKFLFHKLDIVSHFGHLHEEDTHFLPDWSKEPPETKDPVRIVGSMMTMSIELQQQISNSLSVDFFQWSKEPPDTKDPVRIVGSMMTMSSELRQQISNSVSPDETTPIISHFPDVHPYDLTPDSEVASDQLPPPVPPRSPRLSVPPLPPRLYKAPVKISSAQLTNFCVSMNKHLVNLLEAVAEVESEKKRLEEELHLAHHQLGLSMGISDELTTEPPISDDSCTAITEDAESRDQFEDENDSHRSISGEGDCLPKHVPIPEVHILSDAVDPCDDALSAKDIDLETNVDFEQESETNLRSSDDSNAEFQDNCILEKNVEDSVGEDVGEHDADSHCLEHIPSNDLTTTDAQDRLCDNSDESSATF